MKQHKFYYYIGPGNNSQLVKKIMNKRTEWEESSDQNEVEFYWTQNSLSIIPKGNYQGQLKIVNHIQNKHQLSLKCNLITNLIKYCGENSLYVWEITPVSFVVEFQSLNLYDSIIAPFKKFFQDNKPQTNVHQQEIIKLNSNQFIQPKMHLSMQDNSMNYIWILKPNQFNRGRGIQFFQTLDELSKLIKQFIIGIKDSSSNQDIIKSKQFVIQKYIQKPLLINGRKFDIRIFVLLTQTKDLYIYNEGYVRLSSKLFNLTSLDPFIHLTNNAIQKQSKDYEQFEQGNQMSYQMLDYYTEDRFSSQILKRIKSIIVLTWLSVQKYIHINNNSFEIFGYDFMIDSSYKPWLIEVNSNPCLEESSEILKQLLPRMLDEAFQITIDQVVRKNKEGNINNNNWEHLINL